MKKLLMTGALLVFWWPLHADTTRQTQADYYNAVTIGNVNVSSTTWTQVPASQVTGRLGIIIQEYATNTANMLVRISSTSVAPANAVAIGMTIKPADQPYLLSISPSLYLWVKSLATAATEPLFYEELQ